MAMKKSVAALLAILICLTAAACAQSGGAAPAETPAAPTETPQVVFAAGSADPDAEELRLPLADGETALLASLPALRAADFSGSANEEEVAAWAEAHPEIECFYTVTLPDGTVLDSGTRSVDLRGKSVDECEAAAAKLALLPELKSVRLGEEGGVWDWSSLKKLRELLPGPAFKYAFTLYGKELDLSDTSVNLSHIPVEDDAAALREVIPLMSELNYVDMDTTGVANQEMEKLRSEFPDVKFVWRVWFGDAYTVRTDVQRILASKPRAGGMLYNWDVEALSCCHDVVFLDLGHNQQLKDISFVSQMPKLEVAILAMCEWTDATPLLDCPELEYLEMQSTLCSDLEPLAKMEKLEHLNIANIVDIEDITPLYSMKQLKRLYLGSMNRVPAEQVAEFRRLNPDCEVDDLVYLDPTGGHWRYDGDGAIVDRYYLLRMQFDNYKDSVYSFWWNDPLY